MADNYLERKMEDLRRGNLANHAARRAQSRRGYLSFAFPPKRVLIALEPSLLQQSIIDTFLKVDCKVALMDSDAERGKQLAYEQGIRYYHSCGCEAIFSNLISVWREVNIVICDSVMAAEFSELWERQLSKLHIPSEYGGRLIVLNQSEDKEVNYDCQSIHVMLGKFGITVNRISLAAGGENEKETAEKISRLIAFLSLSGNEFINGIIF